jgi:regulator of replication initiation timing
MFEYELNDYFDYNQLYKDLMSKDTAKSKIETAKSNKVTTTNSNGREGLISQMMMDKFDLDLNKDKKFENGRIIRFYVIICLNDKGEILKETKIAKINNNQKTTFEVNDIKYSIELRTQNSTIRRIEDDDGKSEITLKSYKSFKSDNKSLDEFSIDSTNKSEDDKMKKNEKFIARELLDNINGKTYYFRIYYTSHEIDGNLIAKNDIDLKEGLQDIIYYPNLESAKKEEEHKKIEESNKIEEKPSKMEGLTKIKKGSKILIEVKQNTTLEILFGQMETFLKDYSILFPNEQYYYLGFVNSVKAKNIPNEEKFVERIKECEKVNPNFKIFLFTIKDNILFDLELADKANYSLYFRNEVKREIKELKDKVDTLTTEMGSMKTEMGSMKTEMGSMKTEMGSMKTEISKLRKDVDSLKDDNKSLRKEMKDQFESLKNMIMDLMNKKSENDDKNN